MTGKIDAGLELIKHLARAGIDVGLAFWERKLDEDSNAHLCLFSDYVNQHGKFESYFLTQKILGDRLEIGIDPFEVKLFGADDERGKDVASMRSLMGPSGQLPGKVQMVFDHALSEVTIYPTCDAPAG